MEKRDEKLLSIILGAKLSNEQDMDNDDIAQQ